MAQNREVSLNQSLTARYSADLVHHHVWGRIEMFLSLTVVSPRCLRNEPRHLWRRIEVSPSQSHSSLTEVLDGAGDDETADAKAHERVHLPERHELHLR